jgi:5-methylcytosine-specific restriction endonuclease McrA
MKAYTTKFTDKFIQDIRFKLLLNVKLRKKILDRDNYTCALCNEQQNRINRDVILNLHHIIPLCYGDEGIEEAFNDKNLITLCSVCHKRIRHRESDYIEEFTKIIEERS